MLLHQFQRLGEIYIYSYRKEICELFLSSIVHKTKVFRWKIKSTRALEAAIWCFLLWAPV